jgi:hypothetical protein
MDLAWDVDREGNVSLVRCRVRNDDAVPRRVRIESRLDAPVLPPRRGGIPETGWDQSGVTLRLDPGERRAIGFAASAPPADPPVEVTEVAAVDPTEQSGGTKPIEGAKTAESATATALRELGNHRPPRAAVAGGAGEVGGTGGAGSADGSNSTADAGLVNSNGPTVDAGRESDTGRATAPDKSDGDPDGSARPSPGGAEAWFDAIESRLDAVEARIDRAERLTDADLATATAAVAEADGVEALSGLDDRVAADAERLRELSERASTLSARAEGTDAPVEALERLA